MAKKQIRIVAVLGSASSGKSTVAEYLVRGHGFTRMRFAAPLKDMLKTLGLTSEQVDGPQAVRAQPCDLLCGKSPRHAMQTLGTEWRDTIDKRLWARIIRARIETMAAALPEGEVLKIVIDDMRFPHEPEELVHPDWSLTLIGIRRPEVEPTKLERWASRVPMSSLLRRAGHILFGIRPLHRSETAWFGMRRHIDIQNNGTLSDLYSGVRKATRIIRS